MPLRRSVSVLCLIALLFLPFLQSCHSDFPDDVLKPGKMEDVLYDYHIAQALAQQSSNDSIDYNIRLYQKAVFDKYGIDEAIFDHSMQWYERHNTQLKKIYEHIAERLGGNVNNGPVVFSGLNSASGDTLSIWTGPGSVLLCSQNNMLSPVIVTAFFKKRSVYHHDREQRIVPSNGFVKVFVALIEFFDR